MLTPQIIRATWRGVPGHVHLGTGRWSPLIAGGQPTPEEEAAAKTAADEAAAKAAADAEAAAKAAEEEAEKSKLGDAGKAALDAERKARKDAEKRAKDAEAKVKAAEDEKLSDAEKLKKEADDGKALAATATTKLRTVNLRDALADKGYSGAKAKAVAKLLDGVEYDDDDEPKNLDDRLKAAETEYGDLVKPGKPVAGDIDPGGGKKTEQVKLTAEELEAAKATGTTPERYAALKNVSTLADWEALQKAEAAKKQ